jgi:hypothetical protein
MGGNKFQRIFYHMAEEENRIKTGKTDSECKYVASEQSNKTNP